jgi:rhodanese-related sulfurtransferase
MTAIQRLMPTEAYELIKASEGAILLDVRDPVEFSFVGHPVGAINIPWKFAPDMRGNPDFVQQVSQIAPSHKTPIFLICRSGQRSLAAASVLAESGYGQLANIEEGFEGGLDENKHRGHQGGWRYHGLPWVQN